MGLDKLISACALLAILAASTGQLPRIIHAVQIAQLKLLKASSTSTWGQTMLLPRTK